MKKQHWHLFGIPTKFQQLTMELLFGRFPHLVEDIFGLLNGKTFSCCNQINRIWSKNLEEYRLYLVRKIRNHMKNQKIVCRHVDMAKAPKLPEIQHKILHFSIWLNRILGISKAVERNITIEQLPMQFLIQLLRFICDLKLNHIKVNIRLKWVLSMLTNHVTKKELINDGLVYDIIANWDTIGRSLTEEKPSKELKTSLKTLQNKYAAPFPKTFLCAIIFIIIIWYLFVFCLIYFDL